MDAKDLRDRLEAAARRPEAWATKELLLEARDAILHLEERRREALRLYDDAEDAYLRVLGEREHARDVAVAIFNEHGDVK